MHIPTAFKEDNPENLLKIMHENAFATLITTDEKGLPIATSLPFLIRQEEKDIKLQAHFAINNPQWKHLEENQRVLVIFNGPHCYISPSWYVNPGVPTWDYVTVHAYGSATLYENPEQTAELIESLTEVYEESQDKPWVAQDNYHPKMLNAIVGFEITVDELQGKVKLGQNKSIEDLKSVVSTLTKSSSEQDNKVAMFIQKHLESKN